MFIYLSIDFFRGLTLDLRDNKRVYNIIQTKNQSALPCAVEITITGPVVCLLKHQHMPALLYPLLYVEHTGHLNAVEQLIL